MTDFQKGIRFRSLEDFFDFIPSHELVIVEFLRDLIFDVIPDVREKLSYNVPYYSRHRNICFLWPASIPWGGIGEGVNLGFNNGYLLTNPDSFMEKGRRKQVYVKTFLSRKEIDSDRIRMLLLEACEIDNDLRANRGHVGF